MRLNVEMTLNSITAKRFRESAERLADMNLGDDGLLAATVLLRGIGAFGRSLLSGRIVFPHQRASGQLKAPDSAY
jgi:hypothetical protein